MAAIISSIWRTISEPGTPIPLGGETDRFSTLTLTAQKSPTQSNGGLVYIRPGSPTADPFTMDPGKTFVIKAPMQSYFTAAQFFLDGPNYGDGVYGIYTIANPKTFNDIEAKLELATKLVIQTISLSMDDVKVTTGLSDEQREGDSIVCYVPSGSEHIKDSGLWRMDVEVIVRSQAGAEQFMWEKHRLRTAYVRDAIMDSQLPELLSAMVHGIRVQEHSVDDRTIEWEPDPEERKWISRLRFSCIVSGSLIPDSETPEYIGAAGGGFIGDVDGEPIRTL